jgi:hypothetical protein
LQKIGFHQENTKKRRKMRKHKTNLELGRRILKKSLRIAGGVKESPWSCQSLKMMERSKYELKEYGL